MAAISLSDCTVTELSPNSGLKELWVQTINTADATDTIAITLANYGINPLGFVITEGYVQTADGSIITAEVDTTAVAAGVLTITIGAGTNDDTRVIRVVGRSIVNVIAG